MGLSPSRACHAAEGEAYRLGKEPHRCLCAFPPGSEGPAARTLRRQNHPHSPGDVRPDRFAPDPAGGGCVPRRQVSGRLCQGRGSAAGFAPLRRALGAPLADLARYAESEGFKSDEMRPNAWRYRDYVIQSLNADKPYDRFIREQLAGDELFPEDREALVATGFCRHWADE